MICPQCGLPTLPEQKFCRSCGAGLQMTTRRLTTNAAASEREVTPAIERKADEQRGNRLTLWGFVLMFIGVVIGVVGKMLMHQDAVTVVGVLLSLLGMFLTAFPYLLPQPRRRRDYSLSAQPEVLTGSQATTYLPTHERSVEPVPSVTERTTELLKNSAARRPEQKEDGESQA